MKIKEKKLILDRNDILELRNQVKNKAQSSGVESFGAERLSNAFADYLFDKYSELAEDEQKDLLSAKKVVSDPAADKKDSLMKIEKKILKLELTNLKTFIKMKTNPKQFITGYVRKKFWKSFAAFFISIGLCALSTFFMRKELSILFFVISLSTTIFIFLHHKTLNDLKAANTFDVRIK